MTLQDFFNSVGQNPTYLLVFMASLPLCSFLLGIIAKNSWWLSPWKYFYSALIYMASIPGIFAVALNIYFFMFQRRDILQTDVYLQILPILVLLICIYIMRLTVVFEHIPGFSKLSALWLMLFCTFSLMWFIDRTRIMVFSYMPFQYLLGIFAGLFVLIYVAWRRFSS
jgi:hypothetical protein